MQIFFLNVLKYKKVKWIKPPIYLNLTVSPMDLTKS